VQHFEYWYKTVPDISYYINECALPNVTSCGDLGVIVTSDLTPSKHICEIISEGHQRANAILRCFVSRDNTSLVRAFVTLCPTSGI